MKYLITLQHKIKPSLKEASGAKHKPQTKNQAQAKDLPKDKRSSYETPASESSSAVSPKRVIKLSASTLLLFLELFKMLKTLLTALSLVIKRFEFDL